MNIRRRHIVIAGGLAAIAAGIIARRTPHGTEQTGGIISARGLSTLFETPFVDFRGQQHRLSRWSGKVLVVNFWATWCAPCRDEMPLFSMVHSKFAEKGILFVGISDDSAEAVGAFADQHNIAYPLLIGRQSTIDLSADLGNSSRGLPYTLVLGKSREPLLTHTGRLQQQLLESTLNRSISA